MKPESIFFALLAVMTLFTLVWVVRYESRTKDKAASTTERVLARIWLIFRRVVCFFVSLVFLLFGLFIAFASLSHSSPSNNSLNIVGIVACCSVFSCSAFWVGMYGCGRHKTWADDRKIHTERKKRYGWRW